ncbi:MAG: PAS domain S-box protein [Ignavibacteria bacterium]
MKNPGSGGRHIANRASGLINSTDKTAPSHTAQSGKHEDSPAHIDINGFIPFFDDSPDAIILADIPGLAIRKANSQTSLLLNTNSLSLTGTPLLNIFPKKIKEQITSVIRSALDSLTDGGKPAAFRTEVSFNGSLPSPVSINFRLVRLNDSDSLSLIIHDISDQQRIEDNLNESLTNYKILFENFQKGLLLLDTDGIILHVNSIAAHIFGWAEEELRGLGRDSIFDFSDPNLMPAIEQRERTGQVISELKCKRKDGTAFPAEVSSKVYNVSNGGKLICIVVRDLTEKKKNEQLVSDTLEFTNLIFESAPIGIGTYDSTGKCVLANQQYARMVGTSVEKVLEQNYHNLDSWKLSGMYDIANDILTTGGTSHKELEVASSFGRKAWLHIYFAAFHSHGEIHLMIIANDITERKKAEKDLFLSEKHFDRLFQEVPLGMGMIDLNQKFLSVNSKFVEITGYSEEDLKEKTFADISLLDKSEPDQMEMEKILNGNIPSYNISKKYIRKNGSIVWINHTGSVIRDIDGKPVYLIVMIEDITDKKNAEIALKKSEARIHNIINSISSQIAVIDKTGLIIMVNQAWRTFAWLNDGSNLLDQKINYLEVCRRASKNNSPDAIIALNGILDILNGVDIEFSMEFPCHSPKELRWFQMNVTPLDGGGATIVHTNITQKKIAEAEISKKERLLQQVIDTLPVGVLIADNNGLIIQTNKEVGNIWGGKNYVTISDYNEFKGWYYDSKEAVSTEDWALTKAVHSGKITLNEVMHIECFDGTKKTIHNSALPVYDTNGKKITGGIVVIQDITEQKKLEEQLKDLNNNKDKFFSIISHDLRSPFTSLLGFSEFLVNDFDDMTSEEVKSFALNIYKSAQSVFNLIENMLQWSRMQAGRMNFTPVKLNLNKLIESTIGIYQSGARQKNISINTELGALINVMADKNMINTVLRNLLSNALKFTYPGGEIKISATKQISSVLITVEDNGVGISSENIKKIFTLSQKITTTGTDKETGTGLGLILCKDFVEMNGGKLGVESQTGRGTRFIFTLPIAD